VSFTGEGEVPEGGYREDKSVLGKVYIPLSGVEVTGDIVVRYERHPWIERFEVDGIKAAKPVRTGMGSKSIMGFVMSLATIYDKAYDDYNEYTRDGVFDAEAYFADITELFCGNAGNAAGRKAFRKFCGLTENMWREGCRAAYEIAMDTILPSIERKGLRDEFTANITDEFRDYIESGVRE